MDERVTVVIEVPRGDFVKRGADGVAEYVSPLPCPFNYGSVREELGGDGDPLDAVVLGGRQRRGARVTVPVRARVRFVDGGRPDDKLVCSESEPTARERWLVTTFFAWYARAKRWTGRDTRFLGWESPA